MTRSWPENGATAVSMVDVSSTQSVLLGRAVTAMLSLEAKLLALSLLWVGLHPLQRVMVGKRRCSGHWFVQCTAMAAYYLPAPVAFSAASALYYSTSPVNKCTLGLLGGILTMLFATVEIVSSRFGVLFTNMRAYSLRDRPGDCYSFLKWLVFLLFVDWEWARISGSDWPVLVLLLLFLHFGVAFVILFDNKSESTLDCQTKAVADYMKRESSKSSSTSSPFFEGRDAGIDCCSYPFVLGEDGKWITLKDLVQRDDLQNEDKDIWLSYSLCRLLARRYYGFHCAEEGDDKVRRFALADLERTNNNGYKRAFNIVEVQLAFLHDYFFTASLPIIQSGFLYIIAAQKLTVVFAYSILFFGFTIAIPKLDELGKILKLVVAVLATLVPWCVLFGLPKLPVQDLLAFYWRPIHTAFRRLNYHPYSSTAIICLGRLFRSRPNPNAQDVFDPFQTQTDGVYWRNKIGQYSIIQDYDRRRSLKKALVTWFQGNILSQPSYWFIKHLPVEEEEVDIHKLDSMRESVADTLRAIDGPPTNGTRSLNINRDSAGYDWLWTCNQETHTHTILMWHIATCYCDMTPISDDLLVKWHHEAARALSRYCAYLVAFLPEFLPEHNLATKFVFQRVLQEAQQELGTKPMKEEEKRTKIRGLQLPRQHEKWTTFYKGVLLGRQLETLKDELRWKVLAEFWAETILYIAPSDNAEVHIEHLAKGGEFVTHLWAMLSNAGILKRAIGEWHPPRASTTTDLWSETILYAVPSDNAQAHIEHLAKGGESVTHLWVLLSNAGILKRAIGEWHLSPASTTTEGPPTHQLTEALSSSIDEASTSSMSFLPRQTSEPPTNEKGKQLLEECMHSAGVKAQGRSQLKLRLFHRPAMAIRSKET